MEKIAGVLGEEDDAELFRAEKERLKTLVHETYYQDNPGIYADGDQTELAFPLVAGIVPEELTEKVSDNLRRNISEKNSGHLATGLVGVPVMTEWATASRNADLMYSMLKTPGYPGYLHMIENGATTTWEHWDGERSRIHNCFNGIGSWFYQAPGGIRPLDGFPGYKKFLIDLQVPEGLRWTNTVKDTPYGRIQVDWKLVDGKMIVLAAVPVGTDTEVVVPEKASVVSVNGEPAPEGKIVLQSGRHRIEWTE
jgi:alpha-L-rhamnosidase